MSSRTELLLERIKEVDESLNALLHVNQRQALLDEKNNLLKQLKEAQLNNNNLLKG